jgi:hypothetical protein
VPAGSAARCHCLKPCSYALLHRFATFVMAEHRNDSAVELETKMMNFWNEKSSKQVVTLPLHADEEEEVFEAEVYPGDMEEV